MYKCIRLIFRKRRILISISAGFLSTFFFISNTSAESKFEGIYGQIGAGINKTNFNLSSTPLSVSTYSFAVTPSIDNSTNISGVFSAGYLKTIHENLLLGISLDAHPFGSPANNYGLSIATLPTATTVSGSFRNQGNYTFNITPAWEINSDSLLYVKLGYVWGTVQKDYTITTSTSTTSSSQTANLTGNDFGIGFKNIISNQVYWFTEVNYVTKKAVTQSNSFPVTIAGHSLTASYSGTAAGSYYNALVGLGYRY